MCVDKFLENVKLTLTLKISLEVLDFDALVKRLNESTIDIHTVEIESTCKLHQVLSKYSLPSCLKVLRINDNNLNVGDISDLVRSLSGVNSLHELDLRRTKFEECSFYAFISVLSSCKDLRSLSLADNGLTKSEIAGLITIFKSMKNLEKLNLSKSNITEAQANDMLQKLKQAKNLATLDLSHNVLQGNEIVLGICQLQSLEEVDLSHNYIRFSPLPDFEGKHDSLSINMKIISLSCDHMTLFDITQFCSLIRSNLLKLNLDFNHIGNSVLSLCSLGLRIKHLRVLSLANTDISDAGAVHSLVALLFLARELEELNLSSNNLTLADFQQLQLPLLNLSHLKRLNLSNSPRGISAPLEIILPSLKNLQELRLSNTHLNGDDLKRIFQPLVSVMDLKYLELSMNAIGSDGVEKLANILQRFPLLERLDLSRSCLKGDDINVLCQALVPLKKMKYLDLSGNMIDSQILDDAWFLPQTLEELIFSDVIHGKKLFAKIKPLRNLKKLYLTNLKLGACDVEMLATTLSSFPKLEELSLADILYAHCNCDNILSAIKSLGNIRKIDLSRMKSFTESALIDMLYSLLSLEELVLTGMSFVRRDDVLDELFGAIKRLKRLRKLDLGHISLGKEKALFDMLSSLSMLEEIVFPAVVLGNSNDTVGYFSVLGSLRYLKNLDLYWSKICKSAVKALARVLPSSTFLEKLVLRRIDFRAGGEEQLFAALENFKYLRELHLSDMKITKTGTEALARVLPSLTLLEKLVFVRIRREYKCDKQLFAGLRKLKYLKELHLSTMEITKTGTEALANVLPSLPFLEKLVLRLINRNDLSNKQLFAALENLKYLKELKLTNMYITKSGAEALAGVLPSLGLLRKLVLHRVSFERTSDAKLFTAIGSLRSLNKLNLKSSEITKAAATALTTTLPRLHNLEFFILPALYERTLRKNLKAAASFVHKVR